MKKFRYLPLFIFTTLILGCKTNVEKKYYHGEDIYIESPIGNNQKVIELNEEGIKLSQNNEYQKAESKFLNALKLEPENYVVLHNYGLHKSIMGEFDESIRLMESSFTLSDSTYLTAGVNLSRAYYFNNEFKKGIEVATYVIKNTDDYKLLFPAYVHRIGNYIVQKECKIANKEKKKIIEMFNEQPNAKLHFEKIEELFENNCGQHRL